MSNFICVIAAPGNACLEAPLFEQAAQAAAGSWRWLHRGVAAEIECHDAGLKPALALLRPALASLPCDICEISGAQRQIRHFVSDMDSTMITIECIDELADFVGRKAEVAKITEQAMRGEINFFGALEARVALLARLGEEVLAQVCRERVELMPGAKALIATLRRDGVKTALVSGGFTQFTAYVTGLLGFDAHHGNRLEIEGGRLTGRLVPPLFGAAAKLAYLEDFADDINQSLAIGDGANDRQMVERAGLGIAYHAKPTLAQVADIVIAHGDLRAVLYVLGYSEDRIIEG